MIVFYAFFRVCSFFVSRLPFPVIYFFSDILKFLLQYVIRYRRDVTRRNLTHSFPEKSAQEIKKIEDRYYRNLADVILEVIKLEAVSKNSLMKRFSFEGLEIMQDAFNHGRSVLVATGHLGNWEWMGTVLGMSLKEKGFAIIKPLAEKHFHDYLISLRHRFNQDSTIDFQHTLRRLVRNKKEMLTFNVFASDQTPTKADINHWKTFLNKETPFYTGIEKLAKSLDFSVVFMNISRTSRGRYKGEIRLITDNPVSMKELEITDIYIKMLEEAIINQPDNWLWSHRRWKFERTVPAGK